MPFRLTRYNCHDSNVCFNIPFHVFHLQIDYEPSNYIGEGSEADYHQHSQHHQYPEPPEPIIEIIIQDNNETLPEPLPIVQSNGKKKKEQVQVFYVKYHKDEKNGLVIHDPVAALSPIGHEQNNHEDEEEEDRPIIVTPLPSITRKTTTLRTVIRPESEQYESSSGVHVTFNHPHNHHSKSDNYIADEDKVESAIQPVVQLPQNRIGPLSVAPLDKPPRSVSPSTINQGRVVNSPTQSHGNFHLPPQRLVQSLPQRPPAEFSPHTNFVSHSQGLLSNQLTLPSQEPSKPFHPQLIQHQFQHQLQQQRPQIPLNNQHQFGNQQFNQPPLRHTPSVGSQINQQNTILKPPQRPPVVANFNQNQRPFNFHAFPGQQQQNQQPSNVRFPQNNQQQHLQQPSQIVQQRPLLQRPVTIPQQQLPQNNFQIPSQQLLPFQRTPIQFNGPQFTQQQLPLQQSPINFKLEQKIQPSHNSQPINKHNQFAPQSNIVHNQQPEQHQTHHTNVFQGGLVEQKAPNLSQTRPQFIQPQFQQQGDVRFRQEQHHFIQSNFGTDVQVSSSVPKFEHHITETVNPPIFFQSKAVDMEKINTNKNIGPLAGNIGHLPVTQESKIVATDHQHRFAVNQAGTVSNHFSQVFPQQQHDNQQKKHFPQVTYVDGRNSIANTEHHHSSNIISQTSSPVTTRKVATTKATTTTARPSTTKKPNAYYDLPDEIPDDLRKQLEESGVLENAQISILDYDKIGDTSLQDLPPEHLANFFSAGKQRAYY